MKLKLDGDVVVVTGGANGLGRAIATEFASEGAIVVLFDLSPSVRDVAAEVYAAAAFEVDVTEMKDVARAADAVRENLGKVDHLVHAAGIGSGGFGFPYWNIDPTDWLRVLNVNLVGAANVAHAFGPKMAEAKSGTMLFVASVAGQMGSQTDPPYSASKAGVINFAQCAAKDLAPFGVRVNTVCPGMIKTALNRSVYEGWAALQPEDQRLTYETWAADKIQKVVPLGRWQEPEDIAAMVVFLASHRARNVTGQTINVDGGFVMHW